MALVQAGRQRSRSPEHGAAQRLRVLAACDSRTSPPAPPATTLPSLPRIVSRTAAALSFSRRRCRRLIRCRAASAVGAAIQRLRQCLRHDHGEKIVIEANSFCAEHDMIPYHIMPDIAPEFRSHVTVPASDIPGGRCPAFEMALLETRSSADRPRHVSASIRAQRAPARRGARKRAAFAAASRAPASRLQRRAPPPAPRRRRYAARRPAAARQRGVVRVAICDR